MSNQVYANNMEVSCKQAAGKSICAFPDVCMTPPQTPATPPGVPIPYPNTGMASDTSDGSTSVKVSGQEVMLKNKSCFKKSMGDEAGCAPMKGGCLSQEHGEADPATGYDPKKAPCLCVVGPSHHAGTEHGDFGMEYTAERNKWLENSANACKVFTMDVGTSVAAKAGKKAGQTKPGAKGCDEACLKKQLHHGHDDMAELKVMPGDPLPRAPQRADAVLG